MAKSRPIFPIKPQRTVIMDDVIRRKKIRDAADHSINDAVLKARIDRATQHALWLMICSVADAYGFGPTRMQRLFPALQDNTNELTKMRKENGDEYAYEKLRKKAERVVGIPLDSLDTDTGKDE